VQVVQNTTKSEQVRLRAPAPSTLIRSVAWDPGWSATVSVDGGKTRSVAVEDFDLVQQVRVPAGNDLITFHYRPRHLLLASILSLGSVALLLTLLGVWLVRRRGPWSEPDDTLVAGGVSQEEILAGVPARVG
jgi:uncharacterized membrane protein YfhO